MSILLIIAGLVLLIFGGDYLVKGASGMALRLQIPPMLVGMTVVALGTSSPELVVSLQSALQGKPDIAAGNVVGSNIANVVLILGVTVLIFPIVVAPRALKVDWTVMMIASIIFYLMGVDLRFSRLEGLILITLLITYIVISFVAARRKKNLATKPAGVETEVAQKKWIILILYVIFGTAGLILGANWFLEGAEAVARNFGVSDRVIAITLVAFGTSVPELAASVIAAFKKEQEISLGNIIGSNLFNLLAIIGITSTVHPIQVSPDLFNNDIFWMLGTSFILLPLSFMGFRLNRIDGSILLTSYFVFIFLLF
jgi:cation:H+ antiporter